MRHAIFAAAALALAGCGPAPMNALEAAQVLEAFTAGAGPDVCAPGGRGQLRGAVRAYGEAMTENGAEWPALAAHEEEQQALSSVEVSVMISFAAGFVHATDLPRAARGRAQMLVLEHLPHMMRMRRVGVEHCAEVVSMQRAASRYMLEMERMKHAVESARRNGGEGAVAQLLHQNAVIRRAQEDMEIAAAAIQARMDVR
jgi:hypothetical protein